MKIKPIGKILILIVALGVLVGAYRLWRKHETGGGVVGAAATGPDAPVSVEGDQGLLGRPLRVGVVTWPGYVGGLVANEGFKPNKQCIYWNNHKLLVQFMLMEDANVRSKAFAKGGDGGVDIVWSTVDFWANELPGFVKNDLQAKAIMQVDWSRGGDAIVADNSIKRIEDLRGKKISLALFTPSHWLLEYSLENSSLDEAAQTSIVKSLVGHDASPDARADFVAGKVDAAVVWEPDVTEALKKRPNSHVLVSSKTAANLIADLMVARADFIKEHPDVIKAFIQGWFDGTEEANRNPDHAVKVLMASEPLYKDLGEAATRDQLSSVRWADLADNTKMFGLDGAEPLFDRLFKQASVAWVKRGYISQAVTPAVAKDDSFVRGMFDAVPKEARVVTPPEEFKFPPKAPPAKSTESALMTKPVTIVYAAGSASLDANAKTILDQVALTAQAYSNAYIRVEGNTDNQGNPARSAPLSTQRAQAVVNYLTSHYSLNGSRFIAVGNGESKPVATNSTPEGRAKNRRTDIKVINK